MTAIERIQQSAQAGLRNLAASLARSTPDETVPHKRVPRHVLHAQDKLYCEIINSNPLLWGETKRPRHARRPRHAKAKEGSQS